MLICDPCLKKFYNNNPSIRRSVGNCDCCSRPTERSDIPPVKLNPIIPITEEGCDISHCKPVNRFYG